MWRNKKGQTCIRNECIGNREIVKFTTVYRTGQIIEAWGRNSILRLWNYSYWKLRFETVLLLSNLFGFLPIKHVPFGDNNKKIQQAEILVNKLKCSSAEYFTLKKN